MAWFDFVNAVGVVGALGIGAWQSRKLVLDGRERDADRRVERGIELYRDLVVEGDTADSFNRLSVLLRNVGAKQHQVHTWYLMDDGEFAPGKLLDPAQPGLDTAFQDLYRVLWYFERVDFVLHFNLADPTVVFRTTGFHCWWWGQLLRKVRAPKAADALHELAPRAAAWAREDGVYDTWVSRCGTDFDGGPPQVL